MRTLLLILFLFPVDILFCQSIKRQYEGYMKGNGDCVGIEMKLTIDKDSIFGIYYYQTIGADLAIRGSIHKDEVIILEHNSAGKHTGTFNGKWYADGDSLKGKWIRKKDSSSFSFSVRKVDWNDYKLTERNVSYYRGNKNIQDERTVYSEWLEMSDHPDSSIQQAFNTLTGNTIPEKPDMNTKTGTSFYGKVVGGVTIYHTKYKEVTLTLKTNEFISFGDYHTEHWGGSIDNQKGYYLFDIIAKRILHLKDLLREDTASYKILKEWLKSTMKKEGSWNQFVEDFGNLTNYINEESPTQLEQFYLKEDGIYFFFCKLPFSNIYSIDDVRIAYEDFIKILDKKSCIYKWLNNKNQSK